MSNTDIKKYELPGGCIAEVHKVFGSEYYFAIVKEKGRYPEEGKIAHDIGRSEYIYVIEGEMTLVVNKEKIELKKGDSYLINDGDYYFTDGNSTSLVFVKDEVGGTSAIEILTEV